MLVCLIKILWVHPRAEDAQGALTPNTVASQELEQEPIGFNVLVERIVMSPSMSERQVQVIQGAAEPCGFSDKLERSRRDVGLSSDDVPSGVLLSTSIKCSDGRSPRSECGHARQRFLCGIPEAGRRPLGRAL